MPLRWLLLGLLAIAVNATAQNYTISTIAGTGISRGDGGPATSALIFPMGIATDAGGNIYLSDASNHVRKIGANGVIATIAGNSENGFSGDGGPAVAAALSAPTDLAVDTAGNLYIADTGNARIRRIAPSGIIQTVAGNGGCDPSTGTSSVAVGGPAVSAPFCRIDAVAVDAQNRLYIAADYRVWSVTADGTLMLVAGTGGYGYSGDSGPASEAQIGFPDKLAIDGAGNVYIADDFNFNVREVTAADQRIRTVVAPTDSSLAAMAIALDSTGALYYAATGTTIRRFFQGADSLVVTVPSSYGGVGNFIHADSAGALYIASYFSDRVLKYTGGQLVNVAGSYPLTLDPDGVPALSAHLQLNSITAGVAVDASGNVYFPELDNSLAMRIARISPTGTLNTFLGPDTPLQDAGAFNAQSLAFDASGALYFGTFTRVYKRAPDGTITAYAGAPGFPSALGDGGLATAAKLSNPTGLATDAAGNLYIAEPFDNRVRKVSPGGIISTVAGTGEGGHSGDNGPATLAKLVVPVDVAVDSAGNLYIAELTGGRVRKVDRNGIITTVAGSGTPGYSGDGGPATAAQLSGAASITVDPAGNLFVVDAPSAGSTISPQKSNVRIRMVNTAGIITTVAGTGRIGYNGDDRLASTALLSEPHALRADAHGNVYFEDTYNQRVRKLTPGAPPVVVEFYNTILDDFFITANPDEQAAIGGGSAGPGWITTGNRFNAGGPSLVCRFYGSLSPGPNSHFYTIDPDECQALKNLQASTPITQKRWNFESLDFANTAPVGGQCAGGYVPVYRAYNNGFQRGIDSNHRITSNLASYQAQVAKGWNGEGVVMCAPG